MTSIISQIRKNENLIAKITESVNDYFYNDSEEVYCESYLEGSITNTEITSDITFEKEKETVEDLRWTIKIQFSIEQNVEYVNVEGETNTKHLTGLCKVEAWVNFPSKTLNIDDIQDIISDIEIEIIDCEFKRDKTKEEELDNEYHAYSAWQSAIASMSEEEIIGELIKQEKEIARLKLVVEVGASQNRLREMLSKRENNTLQPE